MISSIYVKIQYLFTKTIMVGVALAVVLLVFSFVKNVLKVNSAQSKVQSAQAKLDEIVKEQDELKAQLNYFQSDYYKEKQTRDTLGLAQEGEIVVILPDEEILRRLSPRLRRSEPVYLPDPNWKKWVKLFFES